MIEIIKKGTKKIITCLKCGCVFSYEEEDIRNDCNDYCAALLYKKYIQCPQCNNEIIIKQEK